MSPTSSTLHPPVPKSRLPGSSGGSWNGSRDGGDGGGGGDGPAPGSGEPPISNAHFAVILLMIASTMLFAALVGGFIVLRSGQAHWPPEGTPPFPRLLDLSTAVILASSVTLGLSHYMLARGRQPLFRSLLAATLVLGIAFLALQFASWMQLRAEGALPGTNNFLGKFYLLSWAHGLHALAGLVVLAVVTARAYRDAYRPRRRLGVDLASMFWHFVDLVWVALFFLLRF